MNIFQKFWIWYAIKILKWESMLIYSPDKENIAAITFSNSLSYAKKIKKIK